MYYWEKECIYVQITNRGIGGGGRGDCTIALAEIKFLSRAPPKSWKTRHQPPGSTTVLAGTALLTFAIPPHE